MMELRTFGRRAGRVKVLAAVIGTGAVVAMGAITIAHVENEVGTSTARTNDLPMASVTMTTARTELPISYAPTYTAHPCAKRATMPC
jgi:hypothetical protein